MPLTAERSGRELSSRRHAAQIGVAAGTACRLGARVIPRVDETMRADETMRVVGVGA